jgi:hypothetical protein
MFKSPWFWVAINLLGIAVLAAIGPAEKTLGVNVRVVYLHGAWVWTALAGFLAAALVGLVGLINRLSATQLWSRSLGRTGLFFWISYLPISMWAMQTNWNGMYLAEPRFRVAVIFAIAGLLIQIGVTLLENPAWACAANIAFALALGWVLRSTQNVMHPPSPILSSDAWRIQFYYFGLLFLTLLLAFQVARIWHGADSPRKKMILEYPV